MDLETLPVDRRIEKTRERKELGRGPPSNPRLCPPAPSARKANRWDCWVSVKVTALRVFFCNWGTVYCMGSGRTFSVHSKPVFFPRAKFVRSLVSGFLQLSAQLRTSKGGDNKKTRLDNNGSTLNSEGPNIPIEFTS